MQRGKIRSIAPPFQRFCPTKMEIWVFRDYPSLMPRQRTESSMYESSASASGSDSYDQEIQDEVATDLRGTDAKYQHHTLLNMQLSGGVTPTSGTLNQNKLSSLRNHRQRASISSEDSRFSKSKHASNQISHSHKLSDRSDKIDQESFELEIAQSIMAG